MNNGGVIATGEAARIIARGTKPSEGPKPKRPRQIEVRSGTNLIGGLTEIIHGSGVFITARHVLQQLDDLKAVAESMAQQGLNQSDYQFYEFEVPGDLGNRKLDVILAVPKNTASQYLENIAPSDCNCTPQDGSMSLKLNSQFQTAVEVGDKYYSFQYGTVGTKSVRQSSTGAISQIAPERFYFDLKDGNHTTARSSGSAVLTTKNSGSSWKFSGVVECVVPPRTTKKGVPVSGAIQVVPASLILDAVARETSLSSLVSEKIVEDGTCLKIGGGDDAGN